MREKGNIIICGVGGQGIILASEILSSVLLRAGYDVKQSEVHGMAQRGGSVLSHLRYGKKVYSPVIDPATADLILSFELLEALRHIGYLKDRGKIVVNTQQILPPSVAAGNEDYPPDPIAAMKKMGVSVFPLNALEIARELGEVRVVNTIMTGGLSCFLPMDENVYTEVIKERVKERFVDVNLRAFTRGREEMAKMLQGEKTG